MAEKQTLVEKLGGWTVITLSCLGVIALLMPMVIYYWNLGRFTQISSKQELWAWYGDFVGGIANPMIAFLALIGLVLTIRSQQIEFRKTTKALNEQLDQAKQERAENDLARSFELIRPNFEGLLNKKFPLDFKTADQQKPHTHNTTIDNLLRDAQHNHSKSPSWVALRGYCADQNPTQISVLEHLYQETKVAIALLSAFPEKYRSTSGTFYLLHKEASEFNTIWHVTGHDIGILDTNQELASGD